MYFTNRRWKIRIATALVFTLGWSVLGGEAWATERALRQDPAGVLARLAANPRLTMRPAERAALARAAEEMVRPTPAAGVPASTERQRAASEIASESPSAELTTLAEELDRLANEMSSRTASRAQFDARFESIDTSLASFDRRVRADFARVDDFLKRAKLPAEVAVRQASALAAYQRRLAQIRAAIAPAPRTKTSLAAAARLLREPELELERARRVDPKNLPFRTTTPVSRRLETPAAIAPRRSVRTAAPSAADLAATEEVQLTPEIRALAASLDGDPRRIYEWVRNQIAFRPTAGSVQGSQRTLEAREGNATDIASLLIALLRAAAIPARYVVGVADVPIQEAQNWLGGAPDAAFAERYARVGGVAASVLTVGDEERFRIEHVWVEAFVDYVRGRGAVHRAGNPGDTWLPLDPSFKQHAFSSPTTLFTERPIAAILPPIADPLFVVDESLGRVTNVDDRAAGDRLDVWLNESFAFLDAHGVPATIEGLIGGQAIVAENRSILPASLPYRVARIDGTYATLPPSLRHTIELRGYNAAIDRGTGHTAFSFRTSFPALATHRLGIRFVPATEVDAAILASAREANVATLPIHLVRVVPQVELDGATVARGTAVPMGSRFSVDVVLTDPEDRRTVPFEVVAGDEIVVGANGNGITRASVERRLAEHPVTDAAEYLHQAQLQYYLLVDALTNSAVRSIGVRQVRQPSVGFWSAPLSASYLFDVPWTGVYRSRVMDLRQLASGVVGPNRASEIGAVRQSGILASYLEGTIFERLEGASDERTGGISAVQLLGAAAAQQVPLYRVTPANFAAVLPHLNLPAAVLADVRNAVEQGQIAVVSERAIELGSWRGVGYILEDPATGAGAYLISGGLAGGALLDCAKSLAPRFIDVRIVILFAALLALLLTISMWLPGVREAAVVAVEAFAQLLMMLRFMAPLAAA